jgi:hypothetical protein
MNFYLTDRERKLARFALFRLAQDARERATAAAQDTEGVHFSAGSMAKFFKDADDAMNLYLRLAP